MKHRSFALQCAAVFLLALVIKGAYLRERVALPDIEYPTLDSRIHDEWAKGLAFGKWNEDVRELATGPYFRAPLYPYFTAFVYKVLGDDPRKLLRVQVLMGAFSAVLFFILCFLVFDTLTAWIGVTLYLGYWPITYFECERLIPVLIIFLDLAITVTIIAASRSRRRSLWIASGWLTGLSAVARPNILVAVPGILLWILLKTGKGRASLVRMGVFILAVVAGVLPVTIRNYVVGGDFVPIATQGGINFYIGNNPLSNGAIAVIPGTRKDWWGGYKDAVSIAEKSEGRTLKASEVSSYWYRKGREFLISSPLQAIKLYGRKLALLLGKNEVSNNRQLYFQRARSRVLSSLPVNFALLLGFSIAGLYLILSSKHRFPAKTEFVDSLLPYFIALPYAASIIIFFVTSRYRIPVAILLIPGSAWALSQIINMLKVRQVKKAAMLFFVATVMMSLSSFNLAGVGALAIARGYYDLGVDYFSVNLDSSIVSFNRSIKADPEYAPAWKMRGWAKARKGLYNEALVDLKKATSLDSSSQYAYFIMGTIYHKTGRLDDALLMYENSLRWDSNDVKALNNIAEIKLIQGDIKTAETYLKKAITIDPAFKKSLLGLGMLSEAKGKIDSALFFYAKAMPLPLAKSRILAIKRKFGDRNPKGNPPNLLQSEIADSVNIKRKDY